jgi:hypothetical protein
MKRTLILAVGFFLGSAGLMFSGEPKAPAVAFTLAATGDSGPIPFTLALGPTESRSSGVMSAAYLEYGTNTAIGLYALSSNMGEDNTATGCYALYYNTDGHDNVANGKAALINNIGGYANTAIGVNTLVQNTTGNWNTALGISALNQNTGSQNTAVGTQAGESCKEGNYNIYLGALVSGTASDTNTIRIGMPYISMPGMGQNQTFIAGIVETTLDANMTPAVVGITGEGRLGKFPTEMLPPKGDPGSPGPQGPAGEGLVSGSLLFLRSGTPPTGYVLLGTTNFSVTASVSKKPAVITVNVYQKQ